MDVWVRKQERQNCGTVQIVQNIDSTFFQTINCLYFVFSFFKISFFFYFPIKISSLCLFFSIKILTLCFFLSKYRPAWRVYYIKLSTFFFYQNTDIILFFLSKYCLLCVFSIKILLYFCCFFFHRNIDLCNFVFFYQNIDTIFFFNQNIEMLSKCCLFCGFSIKIST